MSWRSSDMFRWITKARGRGVVLGAICGCLCWWLSSVSPLPTLDRWGMDYLYIARGTRAWGNQVAIVAIDDRSLVELSKPLVMISPELTEVLNYLDQQESAAIALDMLIPEHIAHLPALGPNGEGNAQGVGIFASRTGRLVLPEWKFVEGGEALWVRPAPQWRNKLAPRLDDEGFVNFTEDDDNTIRVQQLRAQDDQGVHACFALAALMRSRGLPGEWLLSQRLTLDDQPIPLGRDETLAINFVGPPGTIPQASFADVLRAARGEAAAPLDVSGKLVLIGVTARGEQDIHVTPFGNQFVAHLFGGEGQLMNGVEVQANTFATLADRAFITTPWWLHPLPWLIALGMLLGGLLARLSLEWGALVVAAHHFAWRGLSLAAFCGAGWYVPMAPMFLLGVVLYAAVFAMRWRWLRRMFGVVKSESIARLLEDDPGKLTRRGEEREISVLFTDVRSFTTFSEAHSPAEVVTLLNAYFQAVVPVIERHGGTVNSYLGDGMLVLFGAPAAAADHADRAVRAAVEMVRTVHASAAQWTALGAPEFRIGVGIHTGPCVLGAVGSRNRLDFTAIGDTVNTASRIESENKRLHTEILISAATRGALSASQRTAWQLSPPLPVSVKGKEESLVLYAVSEQNRRGEPHADSREAKPLAAGSPSAPENHDDESLPKPVDRG